MQLKLFLWQYFDVFFAPAPQGPIKRLAATVEQAVAEQAVYLQRALDSEVAGEWNAEVGAWGARRQL